MKTKWYLKVTDKHMRPLFCNSHYQYKLGEWTPPRRKLVMCESGWHVTSAASLGMWMLHSDNRLFVCISDGKTGDNSWADKTVCRSIQLLFEVKWKDIQPWFLRDVRKALRASGLFTEKFIRKAIEDRGLEREMAAGYYGGGFSNIERFARVMRDNTRLQKKFNRYVERRLKSMGYQ